MKKSIIVVGPKGCGKTTHARALAQLFGLKYWRDWDSVGKRSPHDTLFLAWQDGLGREHGLEEVDFFEAMKRLGRQPRARSPE